MVLLLGLDSVLGATGLDPRRVSVLYMGDPYPGLSPYLAMREDAFIQVSPGRAYYHGGGAMPLKDVFKFMRLYMPRNYADISEKYDVLVLSDAYRQAFTGEQHLWFRDCVMYEGHGLIMVAGLDSFWASSSRPEANWHGSFAEEVLPVEIPSGKPAIKHNWLRQNTMEILRPEHEFMASLPYEQEPLYLRLPVDGQLVWLKPGADQLARWISHEFGNPPLYVTWDIGKGRTFAMLHDWTGSEGEGGGYYFHQWEYYRDYAINMMLFLAKRGLYPDHLVVHQYREEVHNLAIGRSLLLSLVDFIDRFGGNTRRIDQEMSTLRSILSETQEHYLDQEFEAALSGAHDALAKLREIEEISVDIKNQALLWVYIVEWLGVTGVSLLSGTIVWTLMIRRRLYREVGMTRSSGMD